VSRPKGPAVRRRGKVRAEIAASGLAPAVPALGWASLGKGTAARRGDVLVVTTERGVVATSAVAPQVVRIRFTPAGTPARDRSYALVRRPATIPATIAVGGTSSSLATRALGVVVTHDPVRVTVADASGAVLHADDPELGIATTGRRSRVWKRLLDDEQVYGLGEKTGWINRRGVRQGGTAWAMWNTDAFGYDSSTDPIYVSVPFYLVLREGRAHGVFLDSTWRTTFDVGKESPSLLSYGTEGGELDTYVIDGPSPKQVLERYTALTGRMPLPPLWALGYHQCRYSYTPESQVRFVAQSLRERKIPADAVWLDIHHQDSYEPFTWDAERFPDPKKLVGDLRAQGLRTVAIVDPHPRKEPGYAPYDQGVADGHFVRAADGTVYEGAAWPSKAEKDPGPSVFPDFTRPATRDWWGGLHAPLVAVGLAGIWNDMNEPSVFGTPNHSMPLDARHGGDGGDGVPAEHRELHNVYGMLTSRATFEGLERLRPAERPFVLARATFAGGQRWAALWTGDNASTWEHLQASFPMLLGMGLSGLPFVGADVGGFLGSPSAELYTRWLQAAVFYPFMRTHTALGSPSQDPWSYGTRHEAINRRAIELRYELLPHLYDVMEEASRTGLPAIRPLLLEYPDDAETYELDDEILLGHDLLAAPVLHPGVEHRWIYFPKGEWFDVLTGRPAPAGGWREVPVTLESIPLFARAGAFVFRQPVLQHTGERSGKALRVFAYPASSTGEGANARSEASHYEDDGESPAYRSGAYLRRRFTMERKGGRLTIEVGAPEGSYRPAARPLEVHVRWDGPLGGVTVDRTALREAAPATLEKESGVYARSADGFVVVRIADRWERTTLALRP